VINLMIGPKLTTSKTRCPVLETLATRGLIQMTVIDEVHYIRQSALFRPEFGVMISFLGWLMAMMPLPCP
jgi:superfamily II DNA helicase RecQ